MSDQMSMSSRLLRRRKYRAKKKLEKRIMKMESESDDTMSANAFNENNDSHLNNEEYELQSASQLESIIIGCENEDNKFTTVRRG